MTHYDIDKVYNRYADDVISGKLLACKDVILACKRYKSWFSRDDMRFDYEEVDKRIRFVSKLKHFKGKSAGQNFILQPWQQFIFAGIFGFKWNKNNLRVTKNVLIFCARKNGKTSLSAALCLAQLVVEDNPGQEIDFIASTGSQARLGFDMTKNYAESIDPNKLIFKRFRDSVQMPYNKSAIFVRNSDPDTLDGLGSSTFIADEVHAYKNTKLWDVLKSSQGFQKEPLAIAITTAGFFLDGYFLFDWVKVCKSILRGDMEDDTQFSVLYSLDEGDDWKDEATWSKANPSLPYETVEIDELRSECKRATMQPSLEVGFRTKHMNQFVQSSEVWISSTYLDMVIDDVDLAKLEGQPCYAGIDLAAVSDLTALSLCWPPNKERAWNPDKYIFYTKVYLPTSALEESLNSNFYTTWKRAGLIEVTPGNVTDYDYILKDLIALNKRFPICSVAYDEWNSTQFTINATAEGMPMVPYSQSLGNFNKPTKFLEMLIRSQKCVIDKNLCVKWAFNNVVLKADWHENVKPSKTTKENKIDPVIAMIEALGAYLAEGGYGDVEVV